MGGRFSLFLLFLQEINSKRHRDWRVNPRFLAVRRCAEQQKASAVFRCLAVLYIQIRAMAGRTTLSDVIPHTMVCKRWIVIYAAIICQFGKFRSRSSMAPALRSTLRNR